MKVTRFILSFLSRHIEATLIAGLMILAVVQFYVRPQSQSYADIKQSGVLRVLISDDPDTQYAFNNQHYGFEYELLAAFAKSLEVELKLQVVPYGELFTLLENGNADLAVGGIIKSPFIERISQPTISWFQSKLAIVYPRGTYRPKSIADLADDPIQASSRYYQVPQLQYLNLVDDYRSEYDLLTALNNKKTRYAISTNYRAKNAKHYLPNLNRAFLLDEKVALVWALPKQFDPVLLAVLNQFLQIAIDKELPQKLAKHYISPANKLSTFDILSIHKKIKTVLPELEYSFFKAARKNKIDWYLLAAIAYQESHWSNDATSPTGVKGIMQLTNNTAEFLKIEDRLDMTQSIVGAANYIKYLRSKLPDEIKEPQRTWFAVGAYNIGLAHILNAHKKAKKLGLNSQQWITISNLLPNLYNQPYPRGRQAKKYVERVQIFTDIIRFYDNHQRKQTKISPGSSAG